MSNYVIFNCNNNGLCIVLLNLMNTYQKATTTGKQRKSKKK